MWFNQIVEVGHRQMRILAFNYGTCYKPCYMLLFTNPTHISSQTRKVSSIVVLSEVKLLGAKSSHFRGQKMSVTAQTHTGNFGGFTLLLCCLEYFPFISLKPQFPIHRCKTQIFCNFESYHS